jgi:small-conductance mechanosensitive channel
VAVTWQPEQPDTSQNGPRPADPGRAASSPRTTHNRPFKAIISFALACGAAIAVNLYGIPLRIKTTQDAHNAGINPTFSIMTGHLITVGSSIAFVAFGMVSTFAWGRWARAVLTHLVGPAYGSIVRFILIIFGMCVVIVITLSMLGFRVAQLVVGGAVTGVLITIAAQQAMSNLFAGMMLQFAQPFKVGDSIWIRSGGFAGTIEGIVTEVSITYVTLENDEGRVLLPNSQVLASAVSPIRSAPRAGVLTTRRYGRFGRSSPRPPMAHDSESSDAGMGPPDGG